MRDEIREYYKGWYYKNRSRVNEKNRVYREANQDKVRQGSKRYYLENAQSIKDYQKQYREFNKEKASAHMAVHRAVSNGTLVRLPCEFCKLFDVEAHHESYSKEKHLDVVWLCSRCHKRVHSDLLDLG